MSERIDNALYLQHEVVWSTARNQDMLLWQHQDKANHCPNLVHNVLKKVKLFVTNYFLLMERRS